MGTAAVYGVGLFAFRPAQGQQPSQAVFFVLMMAPTVGAVLARILTGGRIRWGRPGWWLVAGLPAFTVAIVGFSLLVGVITDRSGSLWPSTVAHGAWNGPVATSVAATGGGSSVPAFAGSDALLGEFGWVAAMAMVALGLVATWGRLAHGGSRCSERALTTSHPAEIVR